MDSKYCMLATVLKGLRVEVWRMKEWTQSGEGRQGRGVGVQPNNNTGTMGQSGLGRDHKLVHPTMCASFLAMNGGSSMSEAEAAGVASSRGRKPLLSIRLGGMGPHNVTQQLVIILL